MNTCGRFAHARFVHALLAASTLAMCGCATRPPTTAIPEGVMVSLDGVVAGIDTRPWTYDGNAVVQVDTPTHGRVAVQLPARWNLCQASPVDVQALAVGMRVQVVGSGAGAGTLVVCRDAAHRLVPAP
ncbi:MAG: hypothetical protein LCH70_13975 [Proteobacteria bacterium]|nr:hypothetical protein [Pseudomonadota bacterium]